MLLFPLLCIQHMTLLYKRNKTAAFHCDSLVSLYSVNPLEVLLLVVLDTSFSDSWRGMHCLKSLKLYRIYTLDKERIYFPYSEAFSSSFKHVSMSLFIQPFRHAISSMHAKPLIMID